MKTVLMVMDNSKHRQEVLRIAGRGDSRYCFVNRIVCRQGGKQTQGMILLPEQLRELRRALQVREAEMVRHGFLEAED